MGVTEAIMEAHINFRVKPELYEHGDYYIRVPVFKRRHCNMNTMRSHERLRHYANSDLFEGMLARVRRDMFGNNKGFFLSKAPDGVSVKQEGFLWEVSITL